jgi:hypothetical protein
VWTAAGARSSSRPNIGVDGFGSLLTSMPTDGTHPQLRPLPSDLNCTGSARAKAQSDPCVETRLDHAPSGHPEDDDDDHQQDDVEDHLFHAMRTCSIGADWRRLSYWLGSIACQIRMEIPVRDP